MPLNTNSEEDLTAVAANTGIEQILGLNLDGYISSGSVRYLI